LIEQLVPDEVVRGLVAPGDVESLLRALEDPSKGPAREGRDLLLLDTLARAFRDCTARMGRDADAWAWGWLHTLTLQHAVSQRLSLRAADAGADRFPAADLDPMPLGGSDSTLMKGAYRPSDFRITMGASVRLVMDVGAWDNSLWINMPGQSGDPRSPHYADLAPLWARGEYVPMLYTREAVDAATVDRIRLEPSPR
jgi:penicillin amidase